MPIISATWKVEQNDELSPGVQGQLEQYSETSSPLKKKNNVPKEITKNMKTWGITHYLTRV